MEDCKLQKKVKKYNMLSEVFMNDVECSHPKNISSFYMKVSSQFKNIQQKTIILQSSFNTLPDYDL